MLIINVAVLDIELYHDILWVYMGSKYRNKPDNCRYFLLAWARERY